MCIPELASLCLYILYVYYGLTLKIAVMLWMLGAVCFLCLYAFHCAVSLSETLKFVCLPEQAVRSLFLSLSLSLSLSFCLSFVLSLSLSLSLSFIFPFCLYVSGCWVLDGDHPLSTSKIGDRS